MYGIPDRLRPLSAAEEQVLLAVWSCKQPASRRDIGEKLAAKGWRPATVLNFLYRLEDKGWVKSGKEQIIPCAGVFEYIGLDPHTAFLKDLGILEEHGYVVVNASMETAIPGIYGAGDCNVKDLRQVVTACSDGAIAAQNAAHYLRKKGIS